MRKCPGLNADERSSSARRSLPSLNEALLYLKNNGVRRSLGKLVAGYIAGRQRWYITRENLTRYVGLSVVSNGFELRFARSEDLPRMPAFTTRISLDTLRTWCGPDYFFFLALKDGEAVSYRCLSTLVHPGVVGFVSLRQDQIFMVDEFTAPEFRRRGITRQMAIAMTPFLLGRGYREVLGIHRVDNYDTISAVRAKGIPTVGILTRTCFLWKTSFRYKPSLPEPAPLLAPEPEPALIEAGFAGREAA